MPKYNKINKNQKPFKHTSQFYRKLKQKINHEDLELEDIAVQHTEHNKSQLFNIEKGLSGASTSSSLLTSSTLLTLTTPSSSSTFGALGAALTTSSTLATSLSSSNLSFAVNEEINGANATTFDVPNFNNELIEDFQEDEDIEKKMFVMYDKNSTFSEELRNWAVNRKINHAALNELLVILRKYGFSWLPKDSRTILETPRKLNITDIPFIGGCNKISTGKYWYNGVENSLKNILSNKIDSDTTIYISINVDGLPIYKSSGTQFWPILGMVNNIRNLRPITIGISSGIGKPDLEPFLNPFVNEMKKLWSDGCTINGYTVKVKTSFFVCDSPARAHLKGTDLKLIIAI